MGNYIARAIVCVKDRTKRMDIFERASSGRIRGILRHEKDEYIAFDDTVIAIRDEELADYFLKVGFINCNHYANGDEDLAVKLFLELAKMRDDTTYPKYVKFTQDVYRYPDGGEYGVLEYCENEVCEWQDLFNCEPICYYWIDASPSDVAEAVRNGKIKL